MNETQRRTRPTRHTTSTLNAAARRKATFARARRAALLFLALGLLGQLLLTDSAARWIARAEGEVEIAGLPVQPSATATVNFANLSNQSSSPAASSSFSVPIFVEPPPNPAEPDLALKAAPAGRGARASKSGAVSLKSNSAGGVTSPGAEDGLVTASAVGDASRPPARMYGVHSDAGTHAPPDVAGAIGFDRVISMHRSNFVVQDKATGAVLSSVPTETFWSVTGASGVFNPRVLFDRASNRWLLAAASNARSAASSILLAVSQGSDPQGNYYLFRYDADATDAMWADYPSLGFNKNWVTISVNLTNISNDAFNQGLVLAVSFPHLRAGTAATTLFPGISAANGGSTMQPAVTDSETEENEYLVSHIAGCLG
jgi:hypothetical protein